MERDLAYADFCTFGERSAVQRKLSDFLFNDNDGICYIRPTDMNVIVTAHERMLDVYGSRSGIAHNSSGKVSRSHTFSVVDRCQRIENFPERERL